MKTKTFSALFAFLVLSSSGAFAVSKTEKFVNTFLPTPGSVRTASDADVLTATDKAIASEDQSPSVVKPKGVTVVGIVKIGAKYAPSVSPEFGEVGLRRVSTPGSPNLLADVGKKKRLTAAAKGITKATMIAVLKKAGPLGKGVVNKADGAAAVTARLVCAADDVSASAPSLLITVVSAAVKNAVKYGPGTAKTLTPTTASSNGAAGATTGAIAETAGFSNGDITNGGADDTTVKAVITAAGKAGKKRILDVAQAVGYAFAGTYRATTADGSEVAQSAFTTTNEAALKTAIEAALPKKTKNKFDAFILEQIRFGIGLAFAGTPGPGIKGVNQFAFNNCTGPSVTDVSAF